MIFAFVCFAAIILTAVFYKYLVSPFITRRYITELLATERADGPEVIPKIFRSFMPSRNVFSSFSLPIPGREGEEISYGTVAVTRAGIFIVTRICGGGLIENPQKEVTWRFLSQGNVREFPNPFKAQDSARRLLSLYAERAGVSDVCVRTLVVYTDEKLRFSEPPTKGTIHISEIYRKIQRLSRKGKLSYRDIHAIVSAISDAEEAV